MRSIIITTLLIVLASCSEGGDREENTERETPSVVLTEKGVSVFAIELEKSINSYDSEEFKASFSDENFIDLIIEKSHIDASYNRRVIKKELKKAKISNSIFQLLTTSAGRMFKRAGITVTGNDFTITYRISPDVGEIDHLMIIGKMNKDGEVMCYDVMSLTKGDTYSSIFAEMIASNPGLTSELPEWNEHYRLMVESERMGNFSTAIEYYDKLPKNIQSLRLTQMIYLRIAEAHSELKFNSAAINFVKTYNDNDSLSLYNGLLMLKIGQCEKAMYYFEKADSALLGGDSFTNVYRAHVSNCLGDYQGALTYLGQVEDMQTYKNSESITTARMEALIGLSEFDEATLYLPALFQSLGVETPNDELVKLIYPSLYESTEFKEWYSNQAL